MGHLVLLLILCIAYYVSAIAPPPPPPFPPPRLPPPPPPPRVFMLFPPPPPPPRVFMLFYNGGLNMFATNIIISNLYSRPEYSSGNFQALQKKQSAILTISCGQINKTSIRSEAICLWWKHMAYEYNKNNRISVLHTFNWLCCCHFSNILLLYKPFCTKVEAKSVVLELTTRKSPFWLALWCLVSCIN